MAQQFQSEYLKIIPQFNGEPSELADFIAACDLLINTFSDPNQEAFINKFILTSIKTKLIGEAKLVTSSREINTWNALKVVLQNFADQRDENSLLRDLMLLKQESETPQQFCHRCQDIKSLLLSNLAVTELNEAVRAVKHEIKKKKPIFKVTLPPRSEQIINIPVDKDINERILSYIKFNEVETPSSFVTVKNQIATTPIINPTEKELCFMLFEPLKIEAINTFYINPEPIITPIDSNIDQQLKENLKNIRISHLNSEEQRQIKNLCFDYRDIFYCENLPLTFNNQIKHYIRTKDNNPIFTKTYRYPEIHKEEVRKQINSMLTQGIIRPSTSPWSSPIWIVEKKLDASGKKKWRLVADYRKLNEKTVNDKYPLPNITDILDKLGKSIYFTTLDLASGFHQVQMNPDDIEKTAFSTENGHYEYLRMPFGLKNAPATFQRVMDNILRGIQNKKCFVYLDDIIIFSTSLEEHIVRLKEVFERLRNANFKIQLDKSEFLRKEVAYLGHIITPEGVKPNPEKIKAVMKYPIPRTQKEIKSFLGLLGYYRRFIPNFALLTKPLTKCLKKNSKIEHNEQFIKSFETCKQILINHPILQYPDFTQPFILTTDASNVALGAVLSQGKLREDKPIAYTSKH
ncbi:Retrovirus-related Pol polyprotein from transposon 17.6-like Protein [Tribolium castaneum]|uniref:Retrovirus-related Pol polyprotein from transposon 17.6-like Protein n=1 Tax=Tribolium castaneum TaxID=7070 RepID=D7EHT1_TRICA|nr:Retrovirus-related Pol polyprotein from transposon 17.6-like Protein [Tribolium castaneum]